MKTTLKLALFAAMIALPGMALATTLTSVTGTADCDGFEVTGTIHWASALTADFSYTAVLTDDGGVEVASVSENLVLTNGQTPVTYTGAWGLELCGTYTATVNVHMEATSANSGNVDISNGSFTATFVCDCPDGHVCNYTPGYWKNHPENWPVMELALGGVSYSQAQLLAIMGTPVRGDATIILAYHLIAAKLNVLGGSDPSIGGAVTDADNLLMSYSLGSRPSGDAKDMIIDVKNELAGYNELECPDGPIMDSSKSFIDDETPSTWGQLKASYR